MAPPPTSASPFYSAANEPNPSRRDPLPSMSSHSLAFPQSTVIHSMAGYGAHIRSSRTWTSSSGEMGLMGDTDELENRAVFVQEYNRLAKKHGVRILVVDDFRIPRPGNPLPSPEKRHWLLRILRSTSSVGPPPAPLKLGTKQYPLKHRRSVSDIAHNLVSSRNGPTKTLDPQAMVRLSGKSVLYLPPDHTPGSLILPTCIRATAQYLAQHTSTRGVFRIPGSMKIVNALFNYYCYTDDGVADVAGTVRCANLPVHINASVHDVASTFKRLLSVLPGGILGSLSLLDAFVAIHSHLHGEPEFPRTKQTKVRARLIALAIGTIESQFRRELICAVFGLLSLIGRTAEVTPREDENGRPLPTGDLMGYSALGIVFGPLLMGDLLDHYTMNLATPDSGLLLFPLTPKKLRKATLRARAQSASSSKPPNESLAVNKIHIANNITEMLISNWRDICRQMKSLGTHHRKAVLPVMSHQGSLRPSVSEPFVLKKPPGWGDDRRDSGLQTNRENSPEPETPTLSARRLRARSKRSVSSSRLRGISGGGKILSPTAEEGSFDDMCYDTERNFTNETPHKPMTQAANRMADLPSSFPYDRQDASRHAETQISWIQQDPRQADTLLYNPAVSIKNVPPRTSSKQQNLVSPGSRQFWSPNPSKYATSISDVNDARGHITDTTGQGRTRSASSTNLRSPRCHEVLSASARSPRSISAGRASHTSQESRPSLVSSHQAPLPKSGTLRGEIDSEDFKAMIPVPKEAQNYQADTSHDFTSGQTGLESTLTTVESLESRSSINTTPTDFYAPMRVPDSLGGGAGGLDSTGQYHGDGRIGKLDSLPRTNSVSINASKDNHDDSFSKVKRSVQQGMETQFGESQNPDEHIGPSSVWGKPSRSESRDRALNENVTPLPSRQSVQSDIGSRKSGVRAMAAMFEGDKKIPKSATSRPRLGSRGWTSAINHPSTPHAVRYSKSGSLTDGISLQGISLPDRPMTSSMATKPGARRDDTLQEQALRASAPDSVALRAAAIMKAEKQNRGNNPKENSASRLRQVFASPQKLGMDDLSTSQRQKQGLYAPGTMLPHQEQPPVAQHLNRTRPPSAESETLSQDGALQQGNSTPRPGSTSSLHAQIRNLQRQLNVRTEEVAQLRRQLEAQEDSDVGTLSEQLREAKRDASMWKERAEAAERRVQVFKRFTAKLKGIRDAAVVADQRGDVNEATRHSESYSEDSDQSEGGLSLKQQVRFFEGHVQNGRDTSDDSGHTEDAGVITARIRKCLHGEREAPAVAAGNDGAVDMLGLMGKLSGSGSRQNGDYYDESRNISLGASQIWLAAQEFLREE